MLELSHLCWYAAIANTQSKLFLTAFLLSSFNWFFFAFFWVLPPHLNLIALLLVSFFFLLLHKNHHVVYLIAAYSALPKGTHSHQLMPFDLAETPVFVLLAGAYLLKVVSLKLYLGFALLLPLYLCLSNLYNFSLSFLNSPRSFFFNFLEKWVFTTNHKRVGINYMWYVVIAGVVTTVFATAIKLELGEPGSLYCGGNMRLYLSLVTGHAVIMVFLAYVPVYYGVFTNYLIPIQLGARDFAYPRLNNFSFWVFPPSLFFFSNALLKYQGLVSG